MDEEHLPATQDPIRKSSPASWESTQLRGHTTYTLDAAATRKWVADMSETLANLQSSLRLLVTASQAAHLKPCICPLPLRFSTGIPSMRSMSAPLPSRGLQAHAAGCLSAGGSIRCAVFSGNLRQCLSLQELDVSTIYMASGQLHTLIPMCQYNTPMWKHDLCVWLRDLLIGVI